MLLIVEQVFFQKEIKVDAQAIGYLFAQIYAAKNQNQLVEWWWLRCWPNSNYLILILS